MGHPQAISFRTEMSKEKAFLYTGRPDTETPSPSTSRYGRKSPEGDPFSRLSRAAGLPPEGRLRIGGEPFATQHFISALPRDPGARVTTPPSGSARGRATCAGCASHVAGHASSRPTRSQTNDLPRASKDCV